MQGLGRLEETVMGVLWGEPRPWSVREVLVELEAGRSLAYTTVMTVLDNLHRKGLATRRKAGRAYLYEPHGTRADYAASVIDEVLTSAGDRSAALMSFVGRLDPDDARDLSVLLTRHADLLSDRREPKP